MHQGKTGPGGVVQSQAPSSSLTHDSPGTASLHVGCDACEGAGLSAQPQSPETCPVASAAQRLLPPWTVDPLLHVPQCWGSPAPHNNAEPREGREGAVARPALLPPPGRREDGTPRCCPGSGDVGDGPACGQTQCSPRGPGQGQVETHA